MIDSALACPPRLIGLIARAADTLARRALKDLCLHRQWSKFGLYDEATFCRLTDDLC
jgi:hypothetical protein